MRQPVHHHYEQLTDAERAFVDAVFDGKTVYELAQQHGVPLAGDDRVERAVDALARAVIESRVKKSDPFSYLKNSKAAQDAWAKGRK